MIYTFPMITLEKILIIIIFYQSNLIDLSLIDQLIDWERRNFFLTAFFPLISHDDDDYHDHYQTIRREQKKISKIDSDNLIEQIMYILIA